MEINHNNCWFKGICTLNKCDEPICTRYEHMLEMLQKSNLKETQWKKYNFEPVRDDVFAYSELDTLRKEGLKKWYQSFHSLYIWSENYLNGKTAWAVKLLQNYFILWVDYQFNSYPCGYFITANQLKDAYKSQVNDLEKFNQLNHDLLNSELLVIDDVDLILGDEKIEKYLGGILDERYKAEKSVIYTSHLSPEDFKEKTTNKFLQSRIIELSQEIEFKAPTYRKEAF